MRPGISLDSTQSRPRKPSDPIDRPNLTPTSFFLTRDPDSRPANSTLSPLDIDNSPVRSLKETLEDADRSTKHSIPRHKQQDIQSNSRRRSTIKPQIIEDTRQDGHFQQTSPQLPLGTMISPVIDAQEPSSISSPKSISSHSIGKSDCESASDETGSQAIVSSEDEQQEEELSSEVRDSAPQLIMPSIKMPSRRPFTERGKQLGRLKILVAGSEGSGKTSLIKSIVQLCSDIVHVDSVSSASQIKTHERGDTSHSRAAENEIYASTKPYPFWWSDLEESRVLRRRKSVGDAVLERNICFVDTACTRKPERCLQYIEQQLVKSVNIINQSGNELTGLLSGRGGTQVDVVLYLITKETLNDDCISIRRMTQLTSVIPLISKADTLSPEVISELKDITLNGIALPYLPFEKPTVSDHKASAPYCVSSANGRDFDNMDASLLMSPEYVRPLIPSELSLLVEQLFELSTTAYLRHTSAKKLSSWFATEPRLTQISSPSVRSLRPSTLDSPLPMSLSNSGILIPVTSDVSLNTSNSYALAKVADHTHREEHLAHVRLSKWASDLQLSLQRERERYESLARNERALWLVQRMGEEVRNGQVVPMSKGQTLVRANEKPSLICADLRYETHDPLGILRLQDTARVRGWAALQIMGSFGVVGGVAWWLAKTWGITSSLHEWVQEWTAYMFGTND